MDAPKLWNRHYRLTTEQFRTRIEAAFMAACLVLYGLDGSKSYKGWADYLLGAGVDHDDDLVHPHPMAVSVCDCGADLTQEGAVLSLYVSLANVNEHGNIHSDTWTTELEGHCRACGADIMHRTRGTK